MTIEQVRALHPGDEVFWNDPDDGLCSRLLKIVEIEVWPQESSDGDDIALSILDDQDGELQCFASELT